MNAGEQLDERALARAIFAAKRMNFAILQVEADTIEGNNAGEALGDGAGG